MRHSERLDANEGKIVRSNLGFRGAFACIRNKFQEEIASIVFYGAIATVSKEIYLTVNGAPTESVGSTVIFEVHCWVPRNEMVHAVGQVDHLWGLWKENRRDIFRRKGCPD